MVSCINLKIQISYQDGYIIKTRINAQQIRRKTHNVRPWILIKLVKIQRLMRLWLLTIQQRKRCHHLIVTWFS